MKNHKVELAGNRFVIRSDVDEKRIRRIEATLNEKLGKAGGRGQKVNFTDGLVLTLFHVADLMLDREDDLNKLRKSSASSVRSLRSEIEEIQAIVRSRIESSGDTMA